MELLVPVGYAEGCISVNTGRIELKFELWLDYMSIASGLLLNC